MLTFLLSLGKIKIILNSFIDMGNLNHFETFINNFC